MGFEGSFLFSSLVILAIGFLVHEVLRRKPQFFWLLFFLLPLGLTAFWIKEIEIDYLFWIKIYLTLIAACVISLCRINKNINKKYYFYAVYILLVLSMLIPIWRLFLLGALASCLNGATGLLLLALLPRFQSMSISSNKFRDFSWDLSYVWIFLYTFWDFLFVAFAFPNGLITQVCLLLVPLIISLFNRKIWFQSRVYTFSFYLMLGFTFMGSVEEIYLEGRIDSRILMILSATCFLGTLLVFMRTFLLKGKSLWMK